MIITTVYHKCMSNLILRHNHGKYTNENAIALYQPSVVYLAKYFWSMLVTGVWFLAKNHQGL